MVNIAIVGIGYWGPNVTRNFSSLPDVNIVAVSDLEKKRAENACQHFCPNARVETDYRNLAKNTKIDAVAIITPIQTHFELGKFFLKSGRHVFIEKPLAQTVAECRELIELSEKYGRVLMVGHIFEYNSVVQWIKEYLDQGELGRLFYMYSQRVNLGRIQNDINALWSFAPHDVSIMNYWMGQGAVSVAVHGFSYLTNGVEDVVFVTLEYPGGISAHLHLGWLDPRKVRLMTLVGSKNMLVYDDVSIDAKIRLYDKGIANLDEFVEAPESFAKFQFQIRVGDVVIPRMKFSEPLRNECRHFIDCITTDMRPATDGQNGLCVVKVLEAAERSLRNGGRRVEIDPAN
jgi:predicted dehydrogenase